MRIVYFSSHPHVTSRGQTGYGTHVRGICRAFRAAGHDVTTLIIGDAVSPHALVGAPSVSRAKAAIKRVTPVRVWRYLKDRRLMIHDAQAGEQLAALVDASPPDLVYERVGFMQVSGSRVASARRLRHVVEVNAPFVEETDYFEGARSWLAAEASRRLEETLANAARVVAVSGALAAFLEAEYGVPRSRIVVVPNGVEPDEIRVDAELAASLRDRLGLADKRVVGFVGSIFPYHGVDLLVRALAQLALRDVVLLIVGDGQVIPELKRLAADLSCADRVVFTGSVPHEAVYTHVSLMDICAMPRSNWYGSPVKIFEYGAMSKAVLAPATDPVREVMTEDDGWLTEPDVEAVVGALREMLGNETEAARRARNFHAKVMTSHTWRQAAETILQP